ncbi:MAG: MDR family MFS transporter [Anaerolineales bacterium]
MLKQFRTTYREFPREFWILVMASFIDRLGGTLIFPFFALYITQKFNVGMTEAGALLGLFSVSGLVGSTIGGALTDRFGRRSMVLFGLITSAFTSIALGLVNDLTLFYPVAVVVGMLSNIAGPAHQAMVADMLPEGKRAQGFGILRVTANLAWIFGPTIGGFVAAQSYLLLFILDAISSTITALIVFRFIPETKPALAEGEEAETLTQTFTGYRKVAADRPFIGFLVTSIVMLIVYQQLYNTLSVYLRDVHGIPTQGYGMMMSINALTVVVLQFWVTRRTSGYPPLLMMALGTGFYLVGFTMYGFVSGYLLFTLAMVIITFGEMIVVPVGQALAARFAPEAMRGRYMAFFSLSWTFPATIGPLAAGLIMDNYDPNWVWYAGGILCAVSIVGFLILHRTTGRRLAPTLDHPVERTMAAQGID